MQHMQKSLQKAEFEARIFVSFTIVLVVCALSGTVFKGSPSILVLLGRPAGCPADAATSVGFLAEAFLMVGVSLLRMWAGSVLTPHRVMAFRVQVDALKTSGPYRFVRNPIYLADFVAMCGFALCLPLTGLLMPILFYVHYVRLINYEESSLRRQFGARFDEYEMRAPQLIPGLTSLVMNTAAVREFSVTREGFRHNALYLLFVPGFIVASATQQFWHAAVIGLPGVIDWAIVHTKLGIKN